MNIKYNRVSHHKRNNNIKKYEDVKISFINGKNKIFYVNLNDHRGWFSYSQICNFDECFQNTKQLSKRVNNLNEKMGKFFTMNEVITRKSKGKDDITSVSSKDFDKTIKLREKILKENNEFKDFIRLMPIGSLHKNALIMQSRRPRENTF